MPRLLGLRGGQAPLYTGLLSIPCAKHCVRPRDEVLSELGGNRIVADLCDPGHGKGNAESGAREEAQGWALTSES